MPKKGVSAIIATILLLMITIALAGVAYVYMSGMISGRTSKTIGIVDASCTNTLITIVVSNDGTSNIGNGELKVFIDNVECTSEYSDLDPLLSHNTTADVGSTVRTSGVHTVLVVSPSNADRRTVYC